MAEFSVQKHVFVHRKFALVSIFPMFVLKQDCKNHSSPSMVHRNKLE